MNPSRLDSGGHMGGMVLERFTMMKEGFPNFFIPKTIREGQSSAVSKARTPQTMYTNWKGVFEALEIQVPKVTHQPRVDIQKNDLSDRIMGGGSEIIEKSTGFVENDRRKMNQNAKNHYQYKPSAHFVAGAASADPNAPGLYHAAWDVAFDEVENAGMQHHLGATMYSKKRELSSIRGCRRRKQTANCDACIRRRELSRHGRVGCAVSSR
jgi:hypothetical protein